MHKNSFYILALIIVLISCKKQNEATPLSLQKPIVGSEEYYANLRAYKKSDHEIFYAFIGSSGEPGAPTDYSVLAKLPDSIDIVSLWGGWPPVGSYNYQVMKSTREKKGTTFVGVTIVSDNLLTMADSSFFKKYNNGITSYNGQNDSLLSAGFKVAAKALADSIAKYEVDGYDFDYEPSGLLSSRTAFKLYITEVAKYLGPNSKTGKLLIIDSFTEDVPTELIPLIDYYVLQNYSPQGGKADFTSRISNQIPGMPSNRVISVENFEDLWSTGGLLLSYAAWNPADGRKGGCGAYHAEYEYGNTPDYSYCRKAIQLMNPAAN